LIRAGRDHETEARIHFRLDPRLPSAMASLDLFFIDAQGRPTIIDWKAGESLADARLQLLVYALAVARSARWSYIEPERIQLYEVNLLRDQIEQFPVTSTVLEEAEDFVYASLVDLDTLVGGRRYEDLDLNEFDVASKPSICRYCPVAPLCVRLLDEAGRPEEAVVIQGRLL
jgi:hypothetical protein